MKKLIFMAIGAAALYRVAKHYKIHSLEGFIKLIKPQLKEFGIAL